VIEKTIDTVMRSMLADRSSIISALAGADAPAAIVTQVLDRAREVLVQSEPILEDYVQRVNIGPDRIEVKLSLAKLLPDGIDLPDFHISQTRTMRMQRRSNEMRLVLDSDSEHAAVDSVLAKGIAQAHVWAEELFSGKADSLVELVEHHKVSEGYLKKLMPLAFLAPDIVASILAGKQPEGLSKEKLVSKTLSPIWQEQCNALGFDAAK